MEFFKDLKAAIELVIEEKSAASKGRIDELRKMQEEARGASPDTFLAEMIRLGKLAETPDMIDAASTLRLEEKVKDGVVFHLQGLQAGLESMGISEEKIEQVMTGAGLTGQALGHLILPDGEVFLGERVGRPLTPRQRDAVAAIPEKGEITAAELAASLGSPEKPLTSQAARQLVNGIQASVPGLVQSRIDRARGSSGTFRVGRGTTPIEFINPLQMDERTDSRRGGVTQRSLIEKTGLDKYQLSQLTHTLIEQRLMEDGEKGSQKHIELLEELGGYKRGLNGKKMNIKAAVRWLAERGRLGEKISAAAKNVDTPTAEFRAATGLESCLASIAESLGRSVVVQRQTTLRERKGILIPEVEAYLRNESPEQREERECREGKGLEIFANRVAANREKFDSVLQRRPALEVVAGEIEDMDRAHRTDLIVKLSERLGGRVSLTFQENEFGVVEEVRTHCL